LIDLYQGQQDLELKVVRILHDNSFKDDATRIWRAVRYEQRLDFHIEPHTLALLLRDVSYLDTISGDRIRHELELCLEEEKPEKVLLRAGQMGILSWINPALKIDVAMAHKMAKARGRLQPYCPSKELYLAFLIYHLNPEELEQVAGYLKLPKATTRTLQDTIQLKSEIHSLAGPELALSRVYHCLHKYSQTAILANLMTSDSRPVCQHIENYLEDMWHVQPVLTGDDLVEMGIPSGPQIKKLLDIIREARLDGKVKTREDEEDLVKIMGKKAG
jgi:tRNA nucleotidyltransferase (CCA-adding enzyme)